MGPQLRRGGYLPLLLLTTLLSTATFAQTSGAGRCAASAVPMLVRAEGLTERTGDIFLQCTGLAAGSQAAGNLIVYLPVAVTNRVDASGRTTEVILTANGSPIPASGVVSANSITFPGLSLPVTAGGSVDLRISNLRAAVSQLGASSTVPLTASISLGLPIDRPQVTVALPQKSLLAARGTTAIPCYGSQLPANITLDSLIASQTPVASTRVTEGYATAFETRSATADSGTRFLLRFTGFPSGTQLAAPDFVAGSDALAPTRGGDLGTAASIGQYQPGSGALLLARVAGADASGAGGAVASLPLSGTPVTLSSASVLNLPGGTGYLVYEVVDASASGRQSAQIPVFTGIPGGAAGTVAYEKLSLAPLGASAAVPRFEDVPPGEDCQTLGDCEFTQPKLSVEVSPSTLVFTAVAGQKVAQEPGNIVARNVGGGILLVDFKLQYTGTATGWLVLDPPYPTSSKRVFINTAGLAPGTYQATVTVDASPDGTGTVPVTLTISPAPTNPTPPPATTPPQPPPAKVISITRVVNGASLEPAPVVAGSLAIVQGANFGGTAVSVMFDSTTAQVIGSSDTELRVRVPDLGTKTSALVVVTVDGNKSAPHYVSVATAWPAIFPNGVLNQDNSVHSASNGAAAGSIVQVFSTGLPASGSGITVQIHDRKDLVPAYSGAVPGAPVQQVNVRIPSDLPAMTTYLSVCGAGSDGAQYCSPGVPLTITK